MLLVFGGRSGEHEVSVMSARSVADACDTLGHELVGVGISRSGRWVRWDPRKADSVPEEAEPYALWPDPLVPRDVDVAFPALHGPYGEDGCIQGLFELADLPYVGAGVEGSAVAMSKVVQKRLFAQAGLPLVDFVAFDRAGWADSRPALREKVNSLGYPCFAKPAHLGSSVGISKVVGADGIDPAIDRALAHDDQVLVEAFGGPREIEIGVLEQGGLDLSVVGEVVPDGEFYDYEAKYRSGATVLKIPADLPDQAEATLRELAKRAFRISFCEGMARVDFFWDPEAHRLLLNELNSIPGLTPMSMFPRLWESSGKPFDQVVQTLIEHALARHERRAALEAARLGAHEAEAGLRDERSGR